MKIRLIVAGAIVAAMAAVIGVVRLYDDTDTGNPRDLEETVAAGLNRFYYLPSGTAFFQTVEQRDPLVYNQAMALIALGPGSVDFSSEVFDRTRALIARDTTAYTINENITPGVAIMGEVAEAMRIFGLEPTDDTETGFQAVIDTTIDGHETDQWLSYDVLSVVNAARLIEYRVDEVEAWVPTMAGQLAATVDCGDRSSFAMIAAALQAGLGDLCNDEEIQSLSESAFAALEQRQDQNTGLSIDACVDMLALARIAQFGQLTVDPQDSIKETFTALSAHTPGERPEEFQYCLRDLQLGADLLGTETPVDAMSESILSATLAEPEATFVFQEVSLPESILPILVLADSYQLETDTIFPSQWRSVTEAAIIDAIAEPGGPHLTAPTDAGIDTLSRISAEDLLIASAGHDAVNRLCGNRWILEAASETSHSETSQELQLESNPWLQPLLESGCSESVAFTSGEEIETYLSSTPEITDPQALHEYASALALADVLDPGILQRTDDARSELDLSSSADAVTAEWLMRPEERQAVYDLTRIAAIGR